MVVIIKRLKILLITIILMILVIIPFRLYLYHPVNVGLTEVARIYTERDLGYGGLWSMVIDKKHSVSSKFGIELPEVDFNKYNLIYSTGREIKSLSYKKGVTLWYAKGVYQGFPVFKRKLHPHIIFFYKVKKINVYPDDLSPPEKLRIED